MWHHREMAAAQELDTLTLLRHARDRMDREFAQPLDVECGMQRSVTQLETSSGFRRISDKVEERVRELVRQAIS